MRGGGRGEGGGGRPTSVEALAPLLRVQAELREDTAASAREALARWGMTNAAGHALTPALARAAAAAAAVTTRPSAAATAGPTTRAFAAPGGPAEGSLYLDAIWGHRGAGGGPTVPYGRVQGEVLRSLEERPKERQEETEGQRREASAARAGLESAGAFRLEDPTQVGDAARAGRQGALDWERREGGGGEGGEGGRRGHKGGGWRGGGGVPDVTRSGYFGAVWGRRNVEEGGGGAYVGGGVGVRLRSLTDGERAERDREAIKLGRHPGLVAARGATEWGGAGGREGVRDKVVGREGGRAGGRDGIMGGLGYLHDVFRGTWGAVQGGFHE